MFETKNRTIRKKDKIRIFLLNYLRYRGSNQIMNLHIAIVLNVLFINCHGKKRIQAF